MKAKSAEAFSISFVIACLNDQKALEKTLGSLVAIISDKDQVIIADGGSSDDSVETAKDKLSGIKNHHILSQADTGIYNAWNNALTFVENTWVCFLGCGDILKPNYRKTIENRLIHSPKDINFVSSRVTLYENTETGALLIRDIGKRFELKSFETQMKVCHVGALHHSSLFKENKFSEDYKVVSDYLFLLQQRFNIQALFVNEPLILMDAGGVSSVAYFALFEEFRMKIAIKLKPPIILNVELLYKLCKRTFFMGVDKLISLSKRSL